MPGSANRVSLVEAQQNFSRYGSVDRFHLGDTRKPELSDLRDQDWRPIDESVDNIEEPRDRLLSPIFIPFFLLLFSGLENFPLI